MTSQEYIYNRLNFLVEKFPSLIFKYKFDDAEITHIIAVEPLKEYDENKEYLEAESDFVYEFENKYLPETIMFVSLNSLIQVNEPDMVFEFNKFGIIQILQLTPRYKFKSNLDKFELESTEYELAEAA